MTPIAALAKPGPHETYLLVNYIENFTPVTDTSNQQPVGLGSP